MGIEKEGKKLSVGFLFFVCYGASVNTGHEPRSFLKERETHL